MGRGSGNRNKSTGEVRRDYNAYGGAGGGDNVRWCVAGADIAIAPPCGTCGGCENGGMGSSSSVSRLRGVLAAYGCCGYAEAASYGGAV